MKAPGSNSSRCVKSSNFWSVQSNIQTSNTFMQTRCTVRIKREINSPRGCPSKPVSSSFWGTFRDKNRALSVCLTESETEREEEKGGRCVSHRRGGRGWSRRSLFLYTHTYTLPEAEPTLLFVLTQHNNIVWEVECDNPAECNASVVALTGEINVSGTRYCLLYPGRAAPGRRNHHKYTPARRDSSRN